jgi:hypothetical protein
MRAAATTLAPRLHQRLQFRLLIGSQRRLHVELVMNVQFLRGQLRGADLLEFAINRSAIRSRSRHQLPQFQMLYFESSAALDARFLEVGFLLSDLRYLIGSDAKLLSQGRIIDDPVQTHLPAPATAESLSHTAPHHAPAAAAPHTVPAAETISTPVAHAAAHSVVTPVSPSVHVAAHTAAHAIAPLAILMAARTHMSSARAPRAALAPGTHAAWALRLALLRRWWRLILSHSALRERQWRAQCQRQ